MKKLFAAMLLLTAGFSMSAHAGLISGPITFDGGKSVDLQGLEWMPLTYTAGLSRVDVEGGFSDVTKMWGTGGWRYATRNETERLLGSLWGGRYDGWSYDNYAGAASFLELFGVTYRDSALYRISSFMFGVALDCDSSPAQNCFGEVAAYQDFRFDTTAPDNRAQWRETLSYTAGQAGMGLFMERAGVKMDRENNNWTIHSGARNSGVGSLLVRSVDTPVSTVSSPAALSLFALGLCGLLLRRRKIAA